MPIMPNRTARKGSERWGACAAAASFGAGLLLSGCVDNADPLRGPSVAMEDYRVRHPIVLAEDARKLDIFPPPEARGLDRRTYGQVVEFGRFYRTDGEGPITVYMPRGGYGAGDGAKITWIRRALAADGVYAPLQVTTYPIVNRTLASPIRLSFVGLKAKVADPCGQWPSDLASGSSLQGWSNKPYWNYGCSYQSMFAAQVADPRDLVGPRAEDQADTEVETRAIDQIRKGNDPTTDWKTKNSNISSVGTN